jgi:hypothetical protein
MNLQELLFTADCGLRDEEKEVPVGTVRSIEYFVAYKTIDIMILTYM